MCGVRLSKEHDHLLTYTPVKYTSQISSFNEWKLVQSQRRIRKCIDAEVGRFVYVNKLCTGKSFKHYRFYVAIRYTPVITVSFILV
jgi:hypothetical protein